MYNLCKSLHKLGIPLKKFVKIKSITAEEYEEIMGEKYE